MYRIDIGIDLGSSNIGIYMRDEGIVIHQPSVLAYEKKTKKIIAVGNKAKKMMGKTTDAVIVEQPVRNGVISEYQLAERMIKAFVKNAIKRRRIWGRPNVCVTIPVGITEVERRAVEDAVVRTGAREIFLLESPIAAALGTGIDIMETRGHMIVNIGGGTTEIAIISSGDIAFGTSLRIGGDDMDEALARYVRKKYNMEMGKLSAEDAKMEVGTVVTRKADLSCEIKGKDLMNGLPVKIELTANETVEAFSDVMNTISQEIAKIIEEATPELVSDISHEGIFLSGGGAMIHGMDQYLSKLTDIPCHMAEEPMNVVANGAGLAGEYIQISDDGK